MNKSSKSTFAILLAVVGSGILAWVFISGHSEAQEEAEHERPHETTSRIAKRKGEVVIRMDADDQARNGIVIMTLQPSIQRDVVRAAAVVLSAQNLVTLRESYVSARSQLEKAQASLEVSKQEYERLKSLYQNDRNVSLKTFQSAEGTLRTDEANLRFAQSSLALREDTARQQWGAAVAKWVATGSPQLDAVLQQKDLLIQVTIPSGHQMTAPPAALLETPSGKMLTARFLSSLPKLDPRIQGPSFLYIAAGQSSLVPGLNLVARLPSGGAMRGVIIPRSAVVWWQGKAWAYVQAGPAEFVRREVSVESPVENGWFVTQGFVPAQHAVVSGAQQFLSEEFRSQIQVVGEEQKK